MRTEDDQVGLALVSPATIACRGRGDHRLRSSTPISAGQPPRHRFPADAARRVGRIHGPGLVWRMGDARHDPLRRTPSPASGTLGASRADRSSREDVISSVPPFT
jgi:hypothetical protein